MLTALLITNIALAGMLVHTQKKIKGIAKEIDDIGSNLAYIQSNTVEIGTNINEVQKALESKIETSKDEIVKEFNEAYKKAIAYPPALMFFKK